MKLALLMLACLASSAFAAIDTERVVDAIRVAEGIHSRFPYGVKSVKVSSEAEARAVCRRSVVNNIARWKKAGQPKPFVEFMADRWCPIASDPVGHRNWVRNVTRLIQ